MKKGVIFTLDILLSIAIIILIIFLFQQIRPENYTEQNNLQRINMISNDIMNVLSDLKVYEVNTTTINHLIAEKKLKEEDLDKSVLDLIASFWYSGNVSIAKNISQEILEPFKDFCISLEANDIIYQNCNNSSNLMAVASKIETGYELGKPTEGYIARAFLTSIKNKTTSNYGFFGGYEGDGNITKILVLPEDAKIVSVYLEGVFGNNFTLYINKNFSGIYNVSGSTLTPNKWFICNQTFNKNICSFVKNDSNEFNFNFSNNKNNFVGGGFIKVTYNTSLPFVNNNTSVYYFPGIKGLINIYSSFDIPGDLKDMEIYLNYKTNYTVFLSIGNKTVWRSNSTIVQQKITNSTLSNIINFRDLSNKTVPIRFGTETFTETVGGKADVILITDISGSMNWRLDSNINGVNKDCNNINDPDTNRISLAKCLDKEFTQIILNVTGNRVGLVGYSGVPNAIPTSSSQMIVSYTNLTNNSTALINQINTYTPNGATGICGSLRQAIKMLLDQSNSSRAKFIVLMTDGLANVQCNPSNQNSTIGCIPRICPDTRYCTGGGCLYSTCGDWISEKAANDSIQEGCRAAQNGITVYTIGFGPVSSCPISNYTLNEIAKCGNGRYYSSNNASQLINIYRNIAGEIVSLSYETQRTNITGNISLDNILFDNSYIAFNYSPNSEPLKYGEITLTLESPRIGDMINFGSNSSFSYGGFQVPNVLRVNQAKVTSYSSEYWTDKVLFRPNSSQWTNVYNLNQYGEVYQLLGDPFTVQIPAYLIEPNKVNYVAVGTGLSPINSTGGSIDNKVIYEVVVSGVVGYGNAFNSSEAAINDAYNRLLEQIKDYVDVEKNNIIVNEESISGIKWLWGPSIIKVVVWKK
ncbi:MAG: VWA domain-containing protein [Candidatus Aenigmarchaeota archaeon]|nr:VWA domain-containing protein [Candidatus Aenigmarchaeota archaeon]